METCIKIKDLNVAIKEMKATLRDGIFADFDAVSKVVRSAGIHRLLDELNEVYDDDTLTTRKKYNAVRRLASKFIGIIDNETLAQIIKDADEYLTCDKMGVWPNCEDEGEGEPATSETDNATIEEAAPVDSEAGQEESAVKNQTEDNDQETDFESDEENVDAPDGTTAPDEESFEDDEGKVKSATVPNVHASVVTYFNEDMQHKKKEDSELTTEDWEKF